MQEQCNIDAVPPASDEMKSRIEEEILQECASI
jgi:hypothetical protein